MSSGLHDVALALAHLLAVGVEDVAEADDALEGAASLDQRRHGEQAVEPAARLVDGLADVVGGEALAEELLVLERVVPLAERHGAGVEPGVDDLGHAAHLAGAVGTGERDVVDVGPVEFQILWNGTGRHLFELRDGPDAVRMPLLAAPDGQGRAPVPVAAERPVDVAGQPLAEAPVLDVLRVPDHVVVGRDELVLDRRGLDVPRRLGVVEQRRVAAPAERVAVLVGLDAEEKASGLEVGDDGRVCVLDVDPGPRRDLGDEPALEVDGVDHRQVVLHTDAHVLFAEGGRDVDDTGAVGGGDVVAADDEVGALVGAHEAERRLVVQAQQVGARELAQDLGLLAEDLLDEVAREHEAVAAALDERVGDVRVHGRGDVADQRPRRGGPDGERDGLGLAVRSDRARRPRPRRSLARPTPP